MAIRYIFKDTPLPKTFGKVRLKENDATLVSQDRAGHSIIEIGIGKKSEMTRRKLHLLARRVISLAKQNKLEKIVISLADFSFTKTKSIPLEELASLLAENFGMANYEFVQFKSTPKQGWNMVKEIAISDANSKAKNGFKRGAIVAEEINKSRDLSNTPGGDMTPALLARAAEDAARGTKARVRVLSEKEIEKIKMGAVLGVARGSNEEPKFIIIEHKGGTKNDAPIILVGKGVTFDTGGINLKPEQGILDMHLDMSGGAAVIHAVILAARLGIKRNVVALVPAVENMPSGSSYRPGDILKSFSGKTIEVLNTDAEGRLILADALTYAKRYKPALVVDVATLTGASLVALGQQASALTTKKEKLEKLFRKLGEESGDYVWPFPLWEEYENRVKGNFADVANIPASGNTRWGGVIDAAMFLYQFVKDEKSGKDSYPWVHLDIAPRMVSGPGEYLAKGSVGAPIRLLISLLEEY